MEYNGQKEKNQKDKDLNKDKNIKRPSTEFIKTCDIK